VRIVARSTLNAFLQHRVSSHLRTGVKLHLDAWHLQAAAAKWANSAELKDDFRSASIISSDRVVFNIKGNDFRLVVAINYQFQSLYIIWLGTHAEYDKIDVKKVEYDRSRYFDPSDSR
jgi:mRNA interferase HigB